MNASAGQLSSATMRALVLSAVKGAGERGTTRNALLNMLDAATKGADLDDAAAEAVIGQMLEAGELSELGGRLCKAPRRVERRPTPEGPSPEPSAPRDGAGVLAALLRIEATLAKVPKLERRAVGQRLLDRAADGQKALLCEAAELGTDSRRLWDAFMSFEERVIAWARGEPAPEARIVEW